MPRAGLTPTSAGQGRAAPAAAAHPRQSFIDEFCRDQVERRVVLGGEPRPVLRIRTARAARLARAFGSNGWIVFLHALPLAWNGAIGQLAVRVACQVSLGGSQTRLLRHFALSVARRSG